jgi:hypothetical protein
VNIIEKYNKSRLIFRCIVEKKQSQPQKKFDAIGFFKSNFKMILLAAIAMILFNKYVFLIILMFINAFLGMLTLKVSRLVPHISIETVTSSAILVGYLYGWKWGLFFGLAVGLYGYVQISLIKLTTIVNALFMGLSGVLAYGFHSMGFDFWWAFFWTYIIRMNIGFMVFRQLNPDLTENIMHSYGDGFFSIFITFQLMQLMHNIFAPLV